MTGRRDALACEDVVMFVNVATSHSGQREFYARRPGDVGTRQALVEFLHEYVLVNYRDVYAATLALDINDHHAMRVVANLLRSGRDADSRQRAVEGQLIARRLAATPPQRVYKAFRQLRRDGVNNRRTRAIVRDWLAGRRDLAFDAVKYRGALKSAARHAHLPLAGEIGPFLFQLGKQHRFTTPILESFRRAHYGKGDIYQLPYTVAEGLAAKRGIDRVTFLAQIAPRLTKLERLRLSGSASRLDVHGVAPDLAALPLTRLATYTLGLSWQERTQRRDELDAALRQAAARAAGRAAGTWGRVAAVLDDSFSSFGSMQKRNRPLAVALASHYLLAALAAEYHGFWLAHRGDPVMVHPVGATPLGERIVDALETRPGRLVIVSDGWDNAPCALAAEVLRVWWERLDPDRATSVVHLNPVYDAADFDVRRIAPSVPTVGIRDAEDAATLVELARFADGTTGLSELRAHLTARVTRFLAEVAP